MRTNFYSNLENTKFSTKKVTRQKNTAPKLKTREFFDFQDRLADKIRQYEPSSADLARKLHVAPSTVCRYITKEATPTIDGLIRICSILNVSADDLLFGEKRH